MEHACSQRSLCVRLEWGISSLGKRRDAVTTRQREDRRAGGSVEIYPRLECGLSSETSAERVRGLLSFWHPVSMRLSDLALFLTH